jgi:hypothetical protein
MGNFSMVTVGVRWQKNLNITILYMLMFRNELIRMMGLRQNYRKALIWFYNKQKVYR